MPSLRRSSFVPLPAILAGLALFIAAVLPATSAHAATSPITWGSRTTIDAANGFSSVSCPTASFCAAGSRFNATDAAVDIATSTMPTVAGSWTITKVPVAAGDALNSISCPTAGLCVAVDDHGDILSSSDPTGGASAWHVYQPSANDTFTSVSCPSATLCVIIDHAGQMLVSSNPTSTAWTTYATPLAWNVVSCTTTLCAATSGKNVYTTTTPGSDPAAAAGKWTKAAIGRGQLSGVACISGGCVLADDGAVSDSSAYTWSSTNPSGGAGAWTSTANDVFDRVACARGSVSSLCVGWSTGGAYVTATAAPFTGTTADWVRTTAVADTSVTDHVAGVSCPTISLCVAVTSKGAVVVGTDGTGGGGTPTPSPTPTPTPTATPTSTSTPTPSESTAATPTPPTSTPTPVDDPVPTNPITSTPAGPTTAQPPLPSTGYPGAGLLGNDVYAVTGNAVTFALSSANDVTGSLSVQTVNTYAATASRAANAARAAASARTAAAGESGITAGAARAKTKPTAKKKPVTVGSAKFTLKAGVAGKVKLTISKAARTLLASRHSLKVKVTITAKTTAGVTKVTTTTATLKTAAKAKKTKGK